MVPQCSIPHILMCGKIVVCFSGFDFTYSSAFASFQVQQCVRLVVFAGWGFVTWGGNMTVESLGKLIFMQLGCKRDEMGKKLCNSALKTLIKRKREEKAANF